MAATTFPGLYGERPYLRSHFERIERAGIVFNPTVSVVNREDYRLTNNQRGDHARGDIFMIVGDDGESKAVQVPIDLQRDEQGSRAKDFLKDIEGPQDFVAVLHANEYPRWDVIVLQAD